AYLNKFQKTKFRKSGAKNLLYPAAIHPTHLHMGPYANLLISMTGGAHGLFLFFSFFSFLSSLLSFFSSFFFAGPTPWALGAGARAGVRRSGRGGKRDGRRGGRPG